MGICKGDGPIYIIGPEISENYEQAILVCDKEKVDTIINETLLNIIKEKQENS